MNTFDVEIWITYFIEGPTYVGEHPDIIAENHQQAVDFAFAREIDRDEEHLKAMVLFNSSNYQNRLETVIKRAENIEINLIVDKETDKSYLSDVQHPSRLSDSEIKELLRLDSKYNNQKIDLDRLEKKVFLI